MFVTHYRAVCVTAMTFYPFLMKFNEAVNLKPTQK